MKYRVGACVTISVMCEVDADSEEHALELAEELPLAQIVESNTDPDCWHTSGELDGEPFDLFVEVA